jgi:RNA polymerase sigma factor (TIGR02999 family)
MHHTTTSSLSAARRPCRARASSPKPVEPAASQSELGTLLCAWYAELKRLARARTRRLPSWRSLRTTGLVHEAFVRLQQRDRRTWSRDDHFLADVAQAMRDIAVEYMRGKQALKRGGHLVRTGSVSEIVDGDHARAAPGDRLAVFQALERLRAEHPQPAGIVFLRFFCEMTMDEIADWLGVTIRTVERKWAFARTWLKTELGQH